MMHGKQARGRSRELRVLDFYREHGFVAFRAAWGIADVVALKVGMRPQLVQVKSTTRPYEHFRQAERTELAHAAMVAGADAVLAWWPKGGKLTLIAASEWPRTRTEVAA
jgi:Holliday junction resolvase